MTPSGVRYREGADEERRLRLLVVTSTYPRWVDDPEPAFVHELSKRLAGHYEVMVLCPHALGAAIDEEFDGVRIHRYRYAPKRWETLVNDGGILGNLKRQPWKWALVPGFILGQWFSLLGMRRRWQPDVIHAHWLMPQGILAASLSTPPWVVVTSHGADLFALKSGLFRALRSWVARRVTAVTVVSEAMRSRLQEECPAARTYTMPMGVDFEQRFTEDFGSTLRSTNVILAVGRLVEKKGLVYLIEAMPRVLAVHPDARLDIVGFGPEHDRLVERACQLGIHGVVRFLGARPQSELPSYYRYAALFVAPFVEAVDGDQEGLGLVVAEAIGCLCPVLVGDVPAVHDFFDGVRDCVVPQRDVDALASAIIRILADPATARAQALVRHEAVRRKFSWDVVARGYVELFAKTVQKRQVS